MVVVGETETATGATPVPASDTVALETSLVIATDPVKLPVVVGANLIGNVAELPAAMAIGNVDPARLKLVPVTVAPVTDSEVPPVFERVMFCVVELPVTMLPKLILLGETDN